MAKNKILVLAEDYPNNNGGISLMYIHTRIFYYQMNGLDVTVLNFRADMGYIYNGIKVITYKEYRHEDVKYTLLILHAANLKHHYKFLKKYGNRFFGYIFFYHGHEVLRINKSYSKPYPYIRKSKLKEISQDIYDSFKLFMWRQYLPKIVSKSQYVFVSIWMRKNFLRYTKISEKTISGRNYITYNCVGEQFEKGKYNPETDKEYDFITIRGNLDGSKYAVDIVNRIANNTPECSFLLYGKGKFFEFNEKASNLKWIDKTLSHQEIIKILQKSRYALMPTRTDAQGLMMCEMAAFGIPVITSDIDVCHEVFDGFENVFFINNDDPILSLSSFKKRKSICKKDTRFYKKETIGRELDLIKSLLIDL